MAGLADHMGILHSHVAQKPERERPGGGNPTHQVFRYHMNHSLLGGGEDVSHLVAPWAK